jgi:hypothetical protein
MVEANFQLINKNGEAGKLPLQ